MAQILTPPTAAEVVEARVAAAGDGDRAGAGVGAGANNRVARANSARLRNAHSTFGSLGYVISNCYESGRQGFMASFLPPGV